MSNFKQLTINPNTKKYEEAIWVDNEFGSRIYGVHFPDGSIFNADDSLMISGKTKPKKIKDKKIINSVAKFKNEL